MHKIIEINQIYFIKYQKKQHSFNWRYSRRRLQSQLGRIRSWLIYSKTFFESSFPCPISCQFLDAFSNFTIAHFLSFLINPSQHHFFFRCLIFTFDFFRRSFQCRFIVSILFSSIIPAHNLTITFFLSLPSRFSSDF